jgi:hypothetical protein
VELLQVGHNDDETSVPAESRFESGVVQRSMLRQRLYNNEARRKAKGTRRSKASSNSQLGKNRGGERWTYITFQVPS